MNEVVFISLPMNGRKPLDVMDDLARARKAYMTMSDAHHFVSFCHNFQPDIPAEENGAKKGQESVWYLGRALEAISKCDRVFFYGDWQNARGCLIEHEICEKYDIPYVEDGQT